MSRSSANGPDHSVLHTCMFHDSAVAPQYRPISAPANEYV